MAGAGVCFCFLRGCELEYAFQKPFQMGAPMAEPIKRQFVSFAFYKISEEFRKLTKVERQKVKESFVKAAEEFRKDGILLAYSTVGFKAGVDLMLWRISYELDSFQRMDSRLYQSALGPYLTQPASYLAMTKRSTYIDKHSHGRAWKNPGLISCLGSSSIFSSIPS